MNTKSTDAAAAEGYSPVRPVDQPIAWVGADRILLDDVSRFGLRRQVIARRGEPMDVEIWVDAASNQSSMSRDRIHWWLVERGEYWFLWIVWKEEGMIRKETLSEGRAEIGAAGCHQPVCRAQRDEQ